jgi:oxygen-independent coproporphyrinogen-3 oxidase
MIFFNKIRTNNEFITSCGNIHYLCCMAGIYIHVPFCKKKCSYCDFHFSTTFVSYRERMLDTMRNELLARKNELGNEAIDSIYFGGGTPSLLTKDELTDFLELIHREFAVEPSAEITLEANPDDISAEHCLGWRSVGINRLSIGLQSFREDDLTWMNRSHTALEAENCVAIAQAAGFSNISIDLIYGLPDLSLDQWKSHINRVLEMGIQHISAYCLTVEQKTALHALVQAGKLHPGGENDQGHQFLLLTDTLTAHGFHHYEISNFGMPGKEAVHNGNYWKGVSYLGIGPSAHSFNGIERRWNVANNVKYMSGFETNESWFETELLTPKDRWNELLMTGLRTSWGVNLQQLFEILSPTTEFYEKLKEFETNQWLDVGSMHITLTSEGRLMADYIASELFV